MSMRTAAQSLLAGACLLCAAAPRHASAGGGAELVAGIHAYNEGETDKAEGLLRSALKTLRGARDRGLAWFYVGLSQAARDDLRGARASLVRAMSEDPE